MKFVSLLRFTQQGLEEIDQTTQRAMAFKASVATSGIQIENLLWLSGSYDGLILFDAPDIESASAAMLMLAKAGHVTTETLPAFDIDGMNRLVTKI